MALLSDDLLAVYRTTTSTNYKAKVSDIVALTPAPAAPALNTVLQTGNKSLGNDIIIQDANGLVDRITLDASLGTILAAGDITCNGTFLCSSNTPLFKLTEADTSTSGQLSVTDSVLTLTNVEGTTINFNFGDVNVASLSNDGTFVAGAIDGGVYASD
tara:strand:- start:483 stop:956 length:474 start_codon:yes stop_codon:yes gene_type:complete